MSYQTEAIPKGFHTVTPYLHIRDAANAIEFCESLPPKGGSFILTLAKQIPA